MNPAPPWFGRFELLLAPTSERGGQATRGVWRACGGSMGRIAGDRRARCGVRRSGGRFCALGSCPLVAACAVGHQVLSGAIERVAGVRGVHERHPGREWRPVSSLGFRSPRFVHPVLKILRRGVCRPQTLGHRSTLGLPPPAAGRGGAVRDRGGGGVARVEAPGSHGAGPSGRRRWSRPRERAPVERRRSGRPSRCTPAR